MVTIRLFAAARAAAGASEVEVPSGTVAEVLAALLERSPKDLARVLPHCAVVATGERFDHASPAVLSPGTLLDILPPFAGG